MRLMYLHPTVLEKSLSKGPTYFVHQNGKTNLITSKSAAPVLEFVAAKLSLPVPDKVLEKIVASKDFLSAYETGRALYAAGFRGNALTTMLSVSLHESGDGRGRTERAADSGSSVGICQINRDHKFDLDLKNPYQNAQGAMKLYKASGDFLDWVSYQKNRHTQYLGLAGQVTQRIEKEQQAVQQLRNKR